MRSLIRTFVTLFAFAPLIAAAQAPPTPATPPAQSAPQPAPKGEARDPRACAPPQNSAQNSTKGTVGQGAPLSDRLAQTDGVICPPANVDPEIRAPTPNTDANRMPVIPPPGSPGGDPSTRPK